LAGHSDSVPDLTRKTSEATLGVVGTVDLESVADGWCAERSIRVTAFRDGSLVVDRVQQVSCGVLEAKSQSGERTGHMTLDCDGIHESAGPWCVFFETF